MANSNFTPPADISLQYHDYLAILAFLDDSESIKVGSSLKTKIFETTTKKLASVCRSHRNNIVTHAAKLEGVAESDEAGRQKLLDGHLFNPACLYSFGHTDAVAFLTVDVFDALLYISADIELSIEQVSLAFCPKLDSLGLKTEEFGFLEELHDLLGKASPTPDDVGDYRLADHPFCTETPLVAVTRFKLGGFATLGFGAVYQHALIRAMAKRMSDCIDDLRQSLEGNDPSPGEPLIRLEDIESFRCIILDTQGSAELATIMRCTNYSVAMSVVAAIRTITFRDLFPVENGGDGQSVNEIWRQFLRQDQIQEKAEQVFRHDKNAERSMIGNHVFASTYTTLCASEKIHEHLDPQRSNPNSEPDNPISDLGGLVEVDIQFDVSPGHQLSLEKAMKKFSPDVFEINVSADFEAYGKLVASKKEDETPPVPVHKLAADQIHQIPIGRNDFIYSPAKSSQSDVLTLPTRDFVSENRRLIEFFCARSSENDRIETDVRDISSSICVPVPRRCLYGPDSQPTKASEDLLMREVEWNNHLPVMYVLERVRDKLFPGFDSGAKIRGTIGSQGADGNPEETRRGTGGKFDPKRLLDDMRRIGIPRQLRRSITYLYQNFANCLADAHLFDNVLDLYDSFATLQRIVCGPERSGESELSADGVHDLAEMVDAIEDAISHRIAMTRPHNELRDMAVDFRGGLNQLVSASDVPLKCGLGLLRRVAYRSRLPGGAAAQEKWKESVPLRWDDPIDEPLRRNRAAAITRLTFDPRTNCKKLNFFDKKEVIASKAASPNAQVPNTTTSSGFCMAYVKMNVGHIFHPSESVFHLHETAHLIYKTLLGESRALMRYREGIARQTSNPVAQSVLSSAMSTREEELFAGMISFLFVFGSEDELYFKHFLSTHATQIGSYVSDPNLRRYRFLDEFLLAAMTVDCLTDNKERWNENSMRLESDRKRVVAQIAGDFASQLKIFGPLFHGFEDLFGQDRALVVEPYFRKVINASAHVVLEARARAREIYDLYMSLNFPCQPDQRVRELERMCDVIGDALEKGDALVEMRLFGVSGPWSPERRSSEGRENKVFPDDGRIDSLLLTCQTLRAYLRMTYGTIDTQKVVHLPRNAAQGKAIDFSGSHHKSDWNDYMLDLGYAGVFSVLAENRARRVRAEVAVLKALWDISTRLRGRRFVEIIDENWPSES